ncbi:serine/threonine-protein kinase HipA [Microbacterium pseudoresistens]|uniref:Serine/threonine-protein kinase HipA n=2 Tax=Microbacterium pseudoresistens TaxID=640634 RepID=A0A7Y9ETE6_9MICO|nr:serine/threonine-protein kinase HipA [Microbacterium pseudoresistens]
MMRLAVELYGTRVGILEGDPRTYDFTPRAEAIERFGSASTVISVAIPLVSRPRRDHASRRRNWFAEILPEGDQYEYLLAQSALRRGDVPAFLGRYGRDVAGALQIWDLDDPSEPRIPSLRPVTDAEIRTLLDDPISAPLGNATDLGRTSLGGVQPKILLARTRDGWAQALGGHPTTHILKPQLDGEKATVIYDEEYGSRVAREMGLTAFSTAITRFAGRAALVIERYDRANGERIHQEDFNQALGASGNQKYQELGGVVTLRRVATVLQQHAPGADLQRLAEMVLLAAAIGNLDLHTKNLSLLHPLDGEVRLAPAYDLVPHAHHPGDGRMALAINGVYRHAELTRSDLVAEFASWGLRRAERIVTDTLDRIGLVVETETPLAGAHTALQEDIRGFVARLSA